MGRAKTNCKYFNTCGSDLNCQRCKGFVKEKGTKLKYSLLLCLLLLSACASQQPRVIVPAPALREVFRGGSIQGLEDNSGHYMGRPNDYDLVEHACSSGPIYDSSGRYVRTDVRCY